MQQVDSAGKRCYKLLHVKIDDQRIQVTIFTMIIISLQSRYQARQMNLKRLRKVSELMLMKTIQTT